MNKLKQTEFSRQWWEIHFVRTNSKDIGRLGSPKCIDIASINLWKTNIPYLIRRRKGELRSPVSFQAHRRSVMEVLTILEELTLNWRNNRLRNLTMFC